MRSQKQIVHSFVFWPKNEEYGDAESAAGSRQPASGETCAGRARRGSRRQRQHKWAAGRQRSSIKISGQNYRGQALDEFQGLPSVVIHIRFDQVLGNALGESPLLFA